MANKELRITNQIAKIQTAKKCISLMDKLKVVDPRHYAQLHAKGEATENGFKQNSQIQILLQDYSNGTGTNNVRVSFNLAPEQIQFFLTRVSAGFLEFEYSLDKIYGTPDANGYCEAQQFRIKRSVYNSNGQENKNPWNIYISNGRGVKVTNQAGGAYMKGGSYINEKSAFINLTDMDFYMLLKRTDSYINAWEAYAASQVLGRGLEMAAQAARASRVNNQQYQRPYQPQAQGYQQPQEVPQQAYQQPLYSAPQYGQQYPTRDYSQQYTGFQQNPG